MIKEESGTFKTAFCTDYEQLLVRCQSALETWANRREEIHQLGLTGKEIGAELIKLQADFAKSYSLLQKHTRDCPLCQFVAKLGRQQSHFAATSN